MLPAARPRGAAGRHGAQGPGPGRRGGSWLAGPRRVRQRFRMARVQRVPGPPRRPEAGQSQWQALAPAATGCCPRRIYSVEESPSRLGGLPDTVRVTVRSGRAPTMLRVVTGNISPGPGPSRCRRGCGLGPRLRLCAGAAGRLRLTQ